MKWEIDKYNVGRELLSDYSIYNKKDAVSVSWCVLFLSTFLVFSEHDHIDFYVIDQYSVFVQK